MRMAIGVAMVALLALVCRAEEADPVAEVLAVWAKQQGEVKSLVVEVELTSTDLLFKREEKYATTIRYLRTPAGKVFASVEGFWNGKRIAWLLADSEYYLLDDTEGRATRFPTKEKDALTVLFRHYQPLAYLLDVKRAREFYDLKVAKEDDAYLYLQATCKKGKPTSEQPVDDGIVAVVKQAGQVVPKGMPATIWVRERDVTRCCVIKSWQVNAKDGPTEKDFTRPEERAGWKVFTWPW
jgi:hypothetical protein